MRSTTASAFASNVLSRATSLANCSGWLFIDLTTLASDAIQDLEVMDISGFGANQIVLDELSVINVTSAGTLVVKGDSNDTAIIEPGWVPGGTILIDGQVFDIYNKGEATIQLQQALNVAGSISGDFNGDGLYDCADIDQLVSQIASATHNPSFDLTGDGLVNLDDRDAWLAEAGSANLPSGNPYLLGDANLDGTVDGQDFIIWNANKFTSVAAWCSADFNADGFIDGGDFIIWNVHKFQSSDHVRSGPAFDTATHESSVRSVRSLPTDIEENDVRLVSPGFVAPYRATSTLVSVGRSEQRAEDYRARESALDELFLAPLRNESQLVTIGL